MTLLRIPNRSGGYYMVGLYREMGLSEPRHHWIGRWWTSVRSYERTQFPECLHCGLLMKSDGSHTRTCFGAGRP